MEDHLLSPTQQADLSATQDRPGHAPAVDTPSSDRILSAVLASLDDDKAEDVVQIDLRGRSDMSDYMVIATGRSSRQVAAIAENLTDRLKQNENVLCKVEGKDSGDWVLIDAGDVVVHLFRPEVREFYQLEKMWMPRPADAAGSAAAAFR
ncbi:ribosome silencing factor [Pseudoroseicyclus sp. H15]